MHQGESSAARQTLTASALAPGTEATLQELRDPSPRQPHTRHQQKNLSQPTPANQPHLPPYQFLTNLRRARKGAAPGPSGPTAEVLRLVLDEEDATQAFITVATQLANAQPSIWPWTPVRVTERNPTARSAGWRLAICSGGWWPDAWRKPTQNPVPQRVIPANLICPFHPGRSGSGRVFPPPVKLRVA